MATDTVNALSITIKESQSIDEHTLHKKRHFATTLCDLRNHKVFDVIPSKSAKDLETYFSQLCHPGRNLSCLGRPHRLHVAIDR